MGSRRRFMGGCVALLALATASCATIDAPPPAPLRQAISLKTKDGAADALLFTPPGEGPWPAVILWPDLSGLRPVFADMGSKLAAQGYVVLVPNAFYRSVKLDGTETTAQPVVPFADLMRRGAPWRAAASDEAIMADSFSYVAFLDALSQVDKGKPVGTIGVNIGGAHAFVAARAVPTRIAAVAAIHPLAIATSRETSPHLFVDQSEATYLIEIAAPDDEREPGDKGDLRAAFDAAGLDAEIKIVPAPGGFFVADDPGYDEAAAQDAWVSILDLLDDTLR